MKALVLAGGRGSRLRPLSYSMPKQLVPVANKPVLVHCLEALAATGVEDTAVVVGDQAAQIRSTLGDGTALGMRITYIHQDHPRGLADCVKLAQPFLGDDDFVMYLGDNMLLGGIQAPADEFRRRRPAAQIVVTPVPDPREYGVAQVDPDGRVTALVEKPSQPMSDLALIGVYFFTSEIHEAVCSIGPGRRGEYEITDALSWLVARDREVFATAYRGYWKDTGRVEDVLECNRVLLETLTPAVHGEIDADSTLFGAVVVEPGARIVRSVLVGPAIVGAGAVVEDSRIGPYASIGRDCTLRSAGIEQSIVLDGATVERIGVITGSILGRGSRVHAASGSARQRLLVGDDTEVEIAV